MTSGHRSCCNRSVLGSVNTGEQKANQHWDKTPICLDECNFIRRMSQIQLCVLILYELLFLSPAVPHVCDYICYLTFSPPVRLYTLHTGLTQHF